MRSALALLPMVLLASTALGQELGDISVSSNILSDFVTPQLAPGHSGELSFSVTNPYPWAMAASLLRVEIYAFRSASVFLLVEDMESPPVFALTGSAVAFLSLGDIQPAESRRVTLKIETQSDTPSGGVFTQGTYLVRFWLEFDHPAGHAIMVSSRFFTDEEWAYATRETPPEEREAYEYAGNLNMTYLALVLGVERLDGILPDTAFGVKEPLPVWPFHLLAGGSAVAFGLSVYFWKRERSESKDINRGRR